MEIEENLQFPSLLDFFQISFRTAFQVFHKIKNPRGSDSPGIFFFCWRTGREPGVGLTLGELLVLTSLTKTVLLTLDDSGINSQKSLGAEKRLVGIVGLDQGSGDSQS